MKAYECESGCGRCVFFAVDHRNTVLGWAWMLLLFAVHRMSGQCGRMQRP